ncbi:MAG: putative Ig domain-containing protein, partial [Candidatus Pacearchaeota archaeon]
MKKTKLFLVPLALSLLVMISIVVSAQTNSVTISLFYDSTRERNLTINNGDTFGIFVSADSIFENSMRIVVDLIDSRGDTIVNLLNVQTNSDSYFTHLQIGPTAYRGSGNFTIRGTVRGLTSGNTNQDFLYLQVRESTPTLNNPPIITSTPVRIVNESQFYSYQVRASDPDNDPLTYSLVVAPSWLSINRATGLITGTAPSVSASEGFDILIRVSDGRGGVVEQSYVLLVVDTTPTLNNPPIITSTPVRIVNESQFYSYQVRASDPDNDPLTYS